MIAKYENETFVIEIKNASNFIEKVTTNDGRVIGLSKWANRKVIVISPKGLTIQTISPIGRLSGFKKHRNTYVMVVVLDV